MGEKVYFYTLGCRVNQYETDAVRQLFIEKGYEIVTDPSAADICIVNTCTVTGEADRKSRQSLRKMARANPRAIVCAMGCASEMADGVVDADVVCGTRDKNQIVKKIEEFVASKAELSHKSEHTRPEVSKSDEYHDFGTVLSPEGTRAFIKIEDGCNKFCTYCIIPFARGRVASRSYESIISEADSLASKGYKEIVLTGIHTCSYGKDRGEDISSLLKVIQGVAAIDGVERIRLGSLEPMSMTEEFISEIGRIDKLCPHFHLSLQSGSDTVLKRMNRDYNSAEFLNKVNLLRAQFPGMSLTTDVICGFPGETEEEFDETCEFVKTAGFNKLHVFPYSVREGTVASRMQQLPGGVGKARAEKLISWSDREEKIFASKLVGSETSVLLEQEISEGVFSGYTPEYVKAMFEITAYNYRSGDIVSGTVISNEGNIIIVR